MHLDLDDAVAPARLAAPALHVEAEPPRLVAAHLRLRRPAEKLANRVEHARIGRWIRTRRAPDRRLVDIDDFVDIFQAVNDLMASRLSLGAVKPRGNPLVKDLVDQRALARTGNARDKSKSP